MRERVPRLGDRPRGRVVCARGGEDGEQVGLHVAEERRVELAYAQLEGEVVDVRAQEVVVELERERLLCNVCDVCM